jgi:hypothetical protein
VFSTAARERLYREGFIEIAEIAKNVDSRRLSLSRNPFKKEQNTCP